MFALISRTEYFKYFAQLNTYEYIYIYIISLIKGIKINVYLS